MSKARVVVLEVVSGNLSVSAAARAYGMSRQHIHRLLKRYRGGGLEAVDPRSRRPASNPRAVSDDVIIAIVTLREQLSAGGLDAGPLTLRWHLNQRGLPVPSTSQCTQAAVSRSTSARPAQDFSRLISSVLWSPIADSINALSRASPTDPIEPAMPESWSASVNASEVYWASSIGRCNTGLLERV
jgi:hypothetical protein